MYKLVYYPSAIKKLKKLHPNDQKRIIKKLEGLSKNPRDTSLDIRKLVHTLNSFRLRSGDVRAIFEISEDKEMKIIYVWDIDYRGNIY